METKHHDFTAAHQKPQPPEKKDGICVPTTRKGQPALSMYSCLPWELRDYIHTYYVQGPYDNEVIVRHATGSKSAFLVRHSIGTQSYQWIEDPILPYLSPNRIGQGTARELLDAYYRTRIFKFAHRELELLQTFFETDRFGLGMRPADHLRRVHLQIQPSLYAQLQHFKSKTEEIAKCCRALEVLATIKRSCTSVTVHIDLAQDFLSDDDYDNQVNDAAEFVFRIMEVINTLRLDGLKIELFFEGGLDERTGLELCSKSAISLDDWTSRIKVACK